MHRASRVLHDLRWPLVVALSVGLAGLPLSSAAAATSTSPQSPTPTPPLAITTSVLPTAQVGAAYSDTLTTMGGSGTVTWTLPSGSQLPAGLILSSSGVLSGTPLVSGTTRFEVQAQSTGPEYAFPPGRPLNGIAPLPGLSGFLNYVFQQLGLEPPGPDHGSGDPDASGHKDGNGGEDADDAIFNQAVTDLTLTVQSGVTVTTTQLQSAQVGIPYFVSLTAQGGSGSGEFVWSVASGSTLPPGLSLSSTGLLFGTPTQVGSTTFAVQAADVGTPQYPSKPESYTLKVLPPGLQITTYELPDGTLGAPYNAVVSATGGTPKLGANGPLYQWSIVPGSGTLPAGLTLNSTTGVIAGVPSVAGTQGFSIEATDYGSSGGSIPPSSVIEPLTITIHHGVGITVNTSGIPTNLTQGQNIDQVKHANGQAYSDIVTASGGSGSFTYSVSGEPDGLSINSTTGKVTGTPTHAGAFIMGVTATDSQGVSQSAQLVLLVTEPAQLTITTTSLPDGTINVAYPTATDSGFLLQAAGGSTPYIWSSSCSVNLASGSSAVGSCATDTAKNGLPSGMTLAPTTGQLAGTPTVAGSYSVTFVVSDSGNAQSTCSASSSTPSTPTCATATFTLTINGTGLTITSSSPLADAAVGEQYGGGTAIQLQASGGVAPYTWQLEPCPSSQTTCLSTTGLAVETNGVIAGTPGTGTEGTYTFTVEVQDSTGTIASKQFTLTIEPPLTVTTTSLSEAASGVSYSQTLKATGGTGSDTWALTCSGGSSSNACLPSGISLNSSTGQISGTAIQGIGGTYSFTATVKDKGGATASQSLTMSVLSVSTGSLPVATVSQAYSQQLSALGGTPPYTWSCSNVPGGLACSSAGVLSGTPQTAGSYTFAVTVKDANGVSSTRSLSLTVVK